MDAVLRESLESLFPGAVGVTLLSRMGYMSFTVHAGTIPRVDAPNITDWMQGVGSVVTAVTSIVLLIGLGLTWKQLNDAHHWNRMNATFTYFQTTDFLRLDREAVDKLREAHINLLTQTKPLTDPQLDAIWKVPAVLSAVRDLVNFLEDFASAIAAGAIDDATAYQMMSSLVIRYGVVFKPFFDRRRTELGDQTIHVDFEALASKWNERRENAGRQPRS